MSLVRFDLSIVTVKRSFLVSQIVGCPVILSQFCSSPSISRPYGAGNFRLRFSDVCSRFWWELENKEIITSLTFSMNSKAFSSNSKLQQYLRNLRHSSRFKMFKGEELCQNQHFHGQCAQASKDVNFLITSHKNCSTRGFLTDVTCCQLVTNWFCFPSSPDVSLENMRTLGKTKPTVSLGIWHWVYNELRRSLWSHNFD